VVAIDDAEELRAREMREWLRSIFGLDCAEMACDLGVRAGSESSAKLTILRSHWRIDLKFNASGRATESK